MQVNVQFLQQLQPEWSRFVTLVKQKEELDTVSYHKLFDILKQYQNKVNEIRVERIAKTANPLALIASAQTYLNNYYQAPKPQISHAAAPKHASTRHKGKEVAKPVTPPSESGSDEDIDPEQAQKDKEMQKNLALIAKYFKKLYKPTNNNLKTSSNSNNKTVDTTPRNLATLLRNAGSQNGLKTTRITRKRCCCTNKLNKEVLPTDFDNTAEPLEEVQYHNKYNVFANERQHSEQPESINNTLVLEKDDSNVIPDSSNMCNNDTQVDQNDAECDDERDALANLIENLTLDTEENKTILKQLKKANASLTQELKECKTNHDESSRALGEATSSRDSSLIALQTKQTELEKYTALNDRTSDYKIL
ncbi:hypothetical protein Tco_0982049 [Tanacetum coccineum]